MKVIEELTNDIEKDESDMKPLNQSNLPNQSVDISKLQKEDFDKKVQEVKDLMTMPVSKEL